MSPEAFAQMRAAQCAAVPQVIAEVNKEYKDCSNNADGWFTAQSNYCQGVSSYTSTNGISLSNGGTLGHTGVTTSGMTPAECMTQTNTTYKTKTDACTSNKAAGLSAAKTMSDNNCPK